MKSILDGFDDRERRIAQDALSKVDRTHSTHPKRAVRKPQKKTTAGDITAKARKLGIDPTGYTNEQLEVAAYELDRMRGRNLANALTVNQRPESEGTVVRGDSIFETSPAPDNIWGFGSDSLWVAGEGLMIAAPTGVGKTTLGGQVLSGLLGITDRVLDLPVKPATKPVLYLAQDRPTQIVRALVRPGQLGSGDPDQLRDRLVIHKGPLDFSVNATPEALVKYAKSFGAGTLIIDSVKDMLLNVSEEDSGQAFNSAVQYCLREGIEVLAYHHVTKASKGDLADVYGSAWLTAGMGSVIGLHGKAGADGVEFTHLKQPADLVYMGMLSLDRHAGTFTSGHARASNVQELTRQSDVIQFLRSAGENGATVKQIAAGLMKQEAAVRTAISRLGDAVEAVDNPSGGAKIYRAAAEMI